MLSVSQLIGGVMEPSDLPAAMTQTISHDLKSMTFMSTNTVIGNYIMVYSLML